MVVMWVPKLIYAKYNFSTYEKKIIEFANKQGSIIELAKNNKDL